MYIISHRGLGVPNKEGLPNTIDNDFETINNFVAWNSDKFVQLIEVDIWGNADGSLMVGHDRGIYPMPDHWLKSIRLLLHCKNGMAFKILFENYRLGKEQITDFFYHNDEDFVFSHYHRVLVHPKVIFGNFSDRPSIPSGSWLITNELFNPKENNMNLTQANFKRYAGIVTDYPQEIYQWMNEI
jgi:hypothetical protein